MTLDTAKETIGFMLDRFLQQMTDSGIGVQSFLGPEGLDFLDQPESFIPNMARWIEVDVLSCPLAEQSGFVNIRDRSSGWLVPAFAGFYSLIYGSANYLRSIGRIIDGQVLSAPVFPKIGRRDAGGRACALRVTPEFQKVGDGALCLRHVRLDLVPTDGCNVRVPGKDESALYGVPYCIPVIRPLQ